MGTHIRDMTEGKPLRLMIRFSLPMLMASVLQLLYTMVDSAVVGRMLGVTAFAAVGATASFYWLILSAVMAFAHGFGTLFAQRFGAKDMDGLRKAFVTAAVLTAVIGALVGCASALGSASILKRLNTPPELLKGATVYMHWLLGGLPVTFACNLLSAMLRALGDSKTPFRATIAGTVLNIVLDIALVIPLGIAGVAIATVLAQATESIYCFAALKKTGVLEGGGLRCDKQAAGELLRLGLPLGFRNAVIEIGGLVMQWYVNDCGAIFVAGIAATKRMYSLLLVASNAFEAAIATFVVQNYGARNINRIKRGVENGLVLMLASTAVALAITLPFGRQILSLMIAGDPAQIAAVLDVGARQLTVLALGIPVLHMLFLYRSALQGMGNTLIPMLSGFLELALRILSVVLLTPLLGVWGVYLSDPAGWGFAAALLVVSYMIQFKRIRRAT